jgi:hypothetical protein
MVREEEWQGKQQPFNPFRFTEYERKLAERERLNKYVKEHLLKLKNQVEDLNDRGIQQLKDALKI